MKQVLRNLVFILCLAGANFVNADPITDIYQVEVVVFEHMDAKRFQAEHWPKFVGKMDHSKAIDLDTIKDNVPDAIDTLEVLDALDDAGDKPVKKIISESINLVDPKHYLLNNEVKMIKASKTQRFIKHIAWNQPLANNVKSTPIYFTAGKDQEIAALISIKPTRTNFTASLDVIYKIQPEDRKDDPGVDEIRLVRDVRFKKKEVYYVDHPVIGMMIIVSPVVLGTNSYSPLPNM